MKIFLDEDDFENAVFDYVEKMGVNADRSIHPKVYLDGEPFEGEVTFHVTPVPTCEIKDAK